MNSLILSFLIIAIPMATLAQDGVSYYQNIAGDTALYFGRDYALFNKHLEDTLRESFTEGTYRIVFNQNIDVKNDIDITIVDRKNQLLTIRAYERFIDFDNPSPSTLSISIRSNNDMEDDIIGRIFWVYHKEINKKAEPFQLSDINGKDYNLENLSGKVVVFNFWGISCRPCIGEIPHLNKLVEQYKDREDIVFLAVSPDKKEAMSEFLDKYSFSYQQVSNKDNGRLQTSILDYKGIVAPSHAILNKEGEVVFQYLGIHANIEEMLSNAINRHL